MSAPAAIPPPPPAGGYQAVLFDMDGVLVSSIPIHYESFRRLFGAEGVEFRYEDYVRLGSGAAREVLIGRVLGSDLEPERLARLMERKVEIVEEVIRQRGIEPIPGAEAFVRAVRARGLQTAVVTSSRTPGLLLEGAGLADLFETVVDRNDVERPKPHPDLYLAAAEALGVPAGACLAVEDSSPGVTAARAASMRAIALTTTEPESAFTGAHGVYASFADIDLDAWLGPV